MPSTTLPDAFRGRRNIVIASTVSATLVCLLAWWLWPAAAEAGTRELTVTAADGTERRVRLQGLDGAGNPMQEPLDAFFALETKAERDRFLDEMIDEAEAASAEIGGIVANIRQAGSPEELSKALQSAGSGEKKALVIRPDEKSMAEQMPAEFQARMAEFARAMAQRRKERGLPDGPIIMRHRV